ncbi:MAG: hypothetical protein LBD23_01980 [Oscillospiraceae bacterium]|jgi:uroporphyrinogen decarboxylase|nr:hypothetical protein [Oscillospiraceae bacterium]
MNNREKFLSVMNYESDAKMPIVHFGYWDETVDKWIHEGHVKEGESWETISSNLGFDFGYSECFSGVTNLFPSFEEKVLKKLPDGSLHVLNKEGVIELRKPGITCIPAEIGHTLTDRESWEREYLPRLQFSEDRYDFSRLEQYSKNDDIPRGINCGSLYGVIRNWFGIVELSYLAVEDEELYEEVIHTVSELTYNIVKCGLEKADSMGIRFDYGHFWEDICFNNGPLIRPSVFMEKMGPYYKKITDLGKKYGIEIHSLDCDGLIDLLIPTWIENGVNTMFPIEVGTWNASIAPWRKKYGNDLRGVGGMDKRVFAHGKSAVDTEIERLKPLVALGGFIPCPDHRIAPDAEWDAVRYYCDKMRETFC